MCMLCSVQRWSRRVAAMLPWLVVPLILLWAATQLLLPPAYRFEVTSPRLACVSVLLLTLFWYEVLLPRLSLWRARRSARLRDQRRARALELHKLRKAATRRCRNCNNPYRDQNPGGGGKFMCSYCGHLSKRPVLDLTLTSAAAGIANAPTTAWLCAAQGCDDPAAFWLDLPCDSAGHNSSSSLTFFSSRLLSTATRWLLLSAKIFFRFASSSPADDSESVPPDRKRLSNRNGEIEAKPKESRVEKAKRKAEERRLARLEKEMLEEEERKQREEMTKLVEERRRLRDEKAEAEERSKGITPVGEKDARRDAERRRLDRRKIEDKGSSKSNSDCEDMDRRRLVGGDRKRDFLDRKNGLERHDRPHHRSEPKNHATSKVAESKAKYFSRMTGGFLSSSRGFGGGSFFGRTSHSPGPQVNKFSRSKAGPAVDQGNAVKRDVKPAVTQATAKTATAGETRNSWTNSNRPVSPYVQPHPSGLKKSWHQLFSRSAAVSPFPEPTASAPEMNSNPEPNGAQISNAHLFLSQYPPLDSKVNLSQSQQFLGFPPVNVAPADKPLPRFPAGYMPFYDQAEPPVLEEPEQFEDPCYDPDAIALLGSVVSESLDDPDFGRPFISSDATKESHAKLSPIESPLSRSHSVEEKPIKPPHSAVAKEPVGSSHEPSSEQGTWQMWSTPLVQESLGLRGPQNQWLLPNTNQLDHATNFLNGGMRSPLGTSLNDNDPWLQKAPFQQLPADSLFLPHDVPEKAMHSNLVFESPNKSASAYSFGLPGHSWSEGDAVVNGAQEGGHILSPPSCSRVGIGLFTTSPPDAQSVWSLNEKGAT